MADEECLETLSSNSQQTNHSRNSLLLIRAQVVETLLGRTTSRFRGGGHKRRLRIVDFRFTKMDVPSVVQTIEYDPNRSAFISLVKDADGEHRYVLAHSTMKVGDTIITSANAKPIAGNRLKIGNIPTGLMVHNVELIIGRGAQAVRSAGASAQIVSQEGEYTQLKLNSTEVRLVHKECFATVGVVSNGRPQSNRYR
jgi:large subunit ribosomal protein L2